MNYDLNHINESFMNKIKQVRDEKKTDKLTGMTTKGEEMITFESPEFGNFFTNNYNHGHPFTLNSAADLSFNFNDLIYQFEESLGYTKKYIDKLKFKFNELKYFKKAYTQKPISFEGLPSSECLTEVSVPDSWETVPKYTFNDYRALQKVHFPDNITELGEYCLSDNDMTEFMVPKNVRKIGYDILKNSKRLKKLTFEDLNADIEFSVATFEGCPALTDVELPNTMKNFEANLFENCTALTELELPASLEEFHASGIMGCKNTKKLIFHSGVKFFYDVEAGVEADLKFNPDNLTVYIPKEFKMQYQKYSFSNPFKKTTIFY